MPEAKKAVSIKLTISDAVLVEQTLRLRQQLLSLPLELLVKDSK